jgi:hypothetical protein
VRLFVATLLVVLAAGVAVAAPATAAPRLTAAPSTVRFGQALTIRGTGWPVIEFCRRTVRLSLKSAQNAFVIKRVRVRRSGRFTTSWVPRRSRVGAGSWRLVARMRCESGEDGSTVFVRRVVPVRIV